MKTKELLSAIRSIQGDKYSPNLYRWIVAKSPKTVEVMIRVFVATDGSKWIGYLDDGWFVGSRLLGVLCNGGKEQSFAYRARDIERNCGALVEVENFWTEYIADGRCAIDREHAMHFIGEETRWVYGEGTRSCLWCCKAKQSLHKWAETIQREAWRNAEEITKG